MTTEVRCTNISYTCTIVQTNNFGLNFVGCVIYNLLCYIVLYNVIWTTIVCNMISFILFTELQLQKKWKSIRDCFNKYIQNPNRTKRPYVYSKHLQFLLNKSELATTDQDKGASSESDDGKRQVYWSSRKKKMKLAKEEDPSSDDDNDNQEDSTSLNELEINVPLPAKLPRPSKQMFDEFAFANVDQKNEEDTDKMFLLSLLPHLKAIPEEFRLNVKMDLMQVLRQASFNISTDHKII